MKIHDITSQHRRDIRGTMVCEGCGHEQTFVGYDDDHYHRNVVPTVTCNGCGKTAKDLGADSRPLGTKYPAHLQV